MCKKIERIDEIRMTSDWRHRSTKLFSSVCYAKVNIHQANYHIDALDDAEVLDVNSHFPPVCLFNAPSKPSTPE